jgi:hypothetical protein
VIEPPTLPLGRFPRTTLKAGISLYRCHRGPGLWWFASKPDGRFNLADPLGTCYFGLDKATAVREVLRKNLRGRVVTRDNMADRVMSTISTPGNWKLARTDNRRAQDFGCSNAIGADDGDATGVYDVTRQWAEAFHDAGFIGVRYRTHYTSGDGGIALFSDAGDRVDPPGDRHGAPLPGWPTDPHPQPLEDACNEVGIVVVDPATVVPVAALRIPKRPHFPKRKRPPRR